MPEQEIVKVRAGHLAPKAGRYKCTTCGKEIVFEEDERTPPCPLDANIEWELVID